MKTSTILFVTICVVTLGIQILHDIGLYQNFMANQKAGPSPFIALPKGNIKTIVTDSVGFMLHQSSTKNGIQLTQRSDDLKQVLDFTVKNDTLYIRQKNKNYPTFELYLPHVEQVVSNNAHIYYNGTTDKLTLEGHKGANFHVISSRIKQLQLKLSDDSYGELPEKTTIDTLTLSMKNDSYINARNAKIGLIQGQDISEKASLELQLTGHHLQEFIKKK